MVITVRRHIEDEETHDSSSPIESRRGDRKINPSRSKHSETEQRRRSKINERFQMLRELIPENDEKRDKSSFLLEVIHYVQFLKEKLQIYEGSSQEWSPEPAKCFPLRTNSGPVESFVDQSQLYRNFAGHEDNVLDTALLSNVQNMPPNLNCSFLMSSKWDTSLGPLFGLEGHVGMTVPSLSMLRMRTKRKVRVGKLVCRVYILKGKCWVQQKMKCVGCNRK